MTYPSLRIINAFLGKSLLSLPQLAGKIFSFFV